MTKEQLLEIKGGGFGLIGGVIAGVLFLIGVIDGYIRPLKCR